MNQIPFDEAMAQRLERMYHTRDALRRRALVRDAIAARSGERVLDVGCGAGFYEAELAEVVGQSGAILGVDSSESMLGLGEQRCAGLDVAFQLGDASAVPISDADFDVAFSVQVLEYVADTAAALGELRRALRPGGRVVIWDVDWATVSWQASDESRMQRVLHAWDEHLAHPSMPRRLAPQMRAAGFRDVTSEAHSFASTEFDAETYGVALIPLVQDFVAGRGSVSEDEAAAWAREQEQLGSRGEYYFSCTQFCFQGNRAP